MKIVVIGDWHSSIHEEALKRGFEELSHQVIAFKWCNYFEKKSFFDKVQNKFLLGPKIQKIQMDILKVVKSEAPDFVFIYRGTHVTPATVQALQQQTTVVVYNNDDPFSSKQPRYYWRHFVNSLKFSDIALAYRHHNQEDFKKSGATRVGLLRSWFIVGKDKPMPSDQIEFQNDVVFIGHYENDEREKLLEYLLENNIKLRIYGPDWNNQIEKCGPLLRMQLPTKALRGVDYNKMISTSKISLCLLSKLNRDTYTRRCFEIPAMKGLLLAEYTEDLAQMFDENREIVLFKNKEDLLQKIRYYLENENERLKVVEGGYKAVFEKKHDNISRAQEVVDHVVGFKKI